MLALKGLNVHYGKIHVLRDVALRVERGEIVGLVGPNAAGKTTTLRTLIGLKGMATYRPLRGYALDSSWCRKGVRFFPNSPCSTI
jgi:ABC-type multidrug transport system ATPase subunit